jgi:hypothetical protein
MVWHLHELMQTTEGITAVLPQLYTNLVGGSAVLRANAVRAIGEVSSRQQDNLPRLVFEAVLALLRDPYRIVHEFAFRALRRTRLPDEFKPIAKSSVLNLLACYIRDREADRFFIDCELLQSKWARGSGRRRASCDAQTFRSFSYRSYVPPRFEYCSAAHFHRKYG